jgi:type IV pilus assembly protein PilE
MRTPTNKRGFTLIEMMIVVVIVGVLTLIAYPSYTSFLVKANRAAAQAWLMKMSQRNTLYFNDARAFTQDPNDLGMTDEPERVENFYAVRLLLDPNEPPPGFYIIATPKDGTRQEGDGVLFINNRGKKTRGAESW